MGNMLLRTTPKQTSRLRQIVVISVLCLALYCLLLVPDQSLDSSRSTTFDTFPKTSSPKPVSQQAKGKSSLAALSPELLNNRFLTEAQCRASFPGLLKEIDDVVAKGPFTLERKSEGLGPLIARIRHGKLSILSAGRKTELSADMLAHRSATLHQLANALLTWPSSSADPVPDTILAFNHHDDPLPSTLSYSRPADPALNDKSTKHYFAIPHFSFYAWSLPFIGSMSRAAAVISALEVRTRSFHDKIPRAVWRGTAWFNSPRAGRMRQNLVHATAQKPWADAEALDWVTTPSGRNATNALPIEDFCAYKYIIHTEGVTYSGRFQFHTLCASVVVTPPVAWMQHVTHLLRPVFSYTLDDDDDQAAAVRGSGGGKKKGKGKGKGKGVERKMVDLGPGDKNYFAQYPAPWVKEAWPREWDAAEANIVFVAPDWSDLESTIMWLERHPETAEGIARRQRELFHGGGYFSPAAEMCYWRELIRGWSEVVRADGQGFDDLEGMTWEEFSLKEIHK
ncbi:Uu.00g097430.m01.CDS01 [Anthostomella pinea]|uniref:Uu.00g097430.m01.CDS01 n=1 Tax=Anthostomella pinea TaxID=933095 RepID=A0AAI8YCM5_9PEZI|nr:Uu.00g097430.m01.CDS01 [Anthostomella pinea]